jgi:DNA-binding transcriptional regulator GbsR (MarR family)
MYHYLLFEAERQQWTMPFKVPTLTMMAYTGISKEGVSNAREELQKRGLITYSKGEGKGRSALYSLVHNNTNELHTQQYRRITALQSVTDSKTQKMTEDVTQQLSSGPTQELSQELTHESTQTETQESTLTDTHDLTQDLTQGLTEDLPQELIPELPHEAPLYNAPESTQGSAQSLPQKLPLSELRTILLNDTSWHDEMIRLLANDGISIDHTVLTRRIAGFLDWQEKLGVLERAETDCRSHILNSIRKGCLKKQQTYGQPQLAESGQNATACASQPGEEV